MSPNETSRLRFRAMSTNDLDEMANLLGDCGLTWQKVDATAELEVGFHVKTSAQYLGFATEAAIACREYARSHALASRLVSIIHRDNRPSRRVAQKIGMSLDRSLTHSSPVHEVYSMDL